MRKGILGSSLSDTIKIRRSKRYFFYSGVRTAKTASYRAPVYNIARRAQTGSVSIGHAQAGIMANNVTLSNMSATFAKDSSHLGKQDPYLVRRRRDCWD